VGRRSRPTHRLTSNQIQEITVSVSDKTAIVTGAGSKRGIGRATAHALVAAGWNIAVLDLGEASAKDTTDEVADRHRVQAIGVGCDVTDETSVEGALAALDGAVSPIGALVNNAGITLPTRFLEVTGQEWDRIFGTPVGRVGTVDDVADLITYLCRQESGYITGATYDVNGGSHIHSPQNLQPPLIRCSRPDYYRGFQQFRGFELITSGEKLAPGPGSGRDGEWLDARDSAVEFEGVERASFPLDELMEQATPRNTPCARPYASRGTIRSRPLIARRRFTGCRRVCTRRSPTRTRPVCLAKRGRTHC
jgi:hypothetical protein